MAVKCRHIFSLSIASSFLIFYDRLCLIEKGIDMFKQKSLPTSLAYLGGSIAILSCIGILFSYAFVLTSDYAVINIPGYLVFFGGTASIISSGITYGITFYLNAILIIAMQFVVVGSIACFIGFRNYKTMFFSCLILLIGVIGMWLSPLLISLASPNFILDGTTLDYGYYIMTVGASCGLILSLVSSCLLWCDRKIKQ
jgi:uncharacterized membrane protein (UPF0136 family)